MVATAVSATMEDVAQILVSLSQASEPGEAQGILESIGPILSSQQERMKYKSFLESSADLNVVFWWLTSNKSNVELTSVVNGVVNNLLEFLDPNVVLDKYWKQLVSILEDHSDPQVRRTVVRFLKRTGVCTRGCPDLTSALLRALIDEDLGVSVDAKNVLHGQVVKDHSFGTDVFKTNIPTQLSRNKKETLRLRLYDFVVAVAKISPELANDSCHSLLQALCFELFGTEDFLLQLSVMELLVELTEVDHGLVYLEDTGILSKVDDMIEKVQLTSPCANMLMPGLIKFCARVVQKKPDNFVHDYPNFTDLLGQALSADLGDDSSIEMQTLALETVGFIATTQKGKLVVSMFGDGHQCKIVQVLTRLLSRGTSDQKIKALATIANILHGPEDTDTPSENFYQALSLMSRDAGLPPVMDQLFNFIKQPFSNAEPQVSYDVLVTMGEKEWGLKKIASHPGMMEYLLDRSQLHSKEMKDARYRLVKTLKDNPDAEQVFQPEIYRKLRQYVREGPYYVEALVEVALDEGS